jgi:hypothetical protein
MCCAKLYIVSHLHKYSRGIAGYLISIEHIRRKLHASIIVVEKGHIVAYVANVQTRMLKVHEIPHSP